MFSGTMIAPEIAFRPALVRTPAVEVLPPQKICAEAVASERQQLERAVRRVRRELARGVLRERRAKDVQSYLEKTMASRFPKMMSIYGHQEQASASRGATRS